MEPRQLEDRGSCSTQFPKGGLQGRKAELMLRRGPRLLPLRGERREGRERPGCVC